MMQILGPHIAQSKATAALTLLTRPFCHRSAWYNARFTLRLTMGTLDCALPNRLMTSLTISHGNLLIDFIVDRHL